MAAAMIPSAVCSIPGDDQFDVVESPDKKYLQIKGTRVHSIKTKERELVEFLFQFDKTIEVGNSIQIQLIDTQKIVFNANPLY